MSPELKPKSDSGKNRVLEKKWGKKVVEAGYTAVPDLFDQVPAADEAEAQATAVR
jgi:hypothetical protein